MLDQLDTLDTNFRFMSNPEFLLHISAIASSMASHPAYQGPWPDFVPTPHELKTAAENLGNLIQAAATGDRQKIAERNAQRSSLEVAATMMAMYAMMSAVRANDPSRLQNTGYAFKSKTSARSTRTDGLPEPPPTDLKVKHGPVSGTVVARAKKAGLTGPFELQLSDGEPTSDESWKSLGHYKACGGIEVNGLEPGHKYFFRIRTSKGNIAGPWSPVISIIAL